MAAASSPEAFGEFYDRLFPRVLAFLRPRVGSPEQAFDLAAETFARSLERASSFEDRGRGSATGWVLTIARHLVVDAYRRSRVADDARVRLGMARIEILDEDLERLEETSGVDGSTSLSVALNDLPAEQRSALLARVVEERAYRDIAQELVTSEGVVRKRVSRGLQSLREHLKEEAS